MISLTASPDPFEARALLAAAVAHKPQRGRLAALQLARTAKVGFVRDGALLAILTALPTDLVVDGRPSLEISVAGVPALAHARADMRACVRLARLTLDALHQDGTVALLGVVRAGHRPGAKLARLTGFTLRDQRDGLDLYARTPWPPLPS